MTDKTLLILVGGGLAAWYLFMRPVAPVLPPLVAPPNPYNGVAGYVPQYNVPTDPGDRNAWVPQLTSSLVGLAGGIVQAVNNGSGPATSSGNYSGTDPYASSVGDGGWSSETQGWEYI